MFSRAIVVVLLTSNPNIVPSKMITNGYHYKIIKKTAKNMLFLKINSRWFYKSKSAVLVSATVTASRYLFYCLTYFSSYISLNYYHSISFNFYRIISYFTKINFSTMITNAIIWYIIFLAKKTFFSFQDLFFSFHTAIIINNKVRII